LKDCVRPRRGRISAWRGVKKSARPVALGRPSLAPLRRRAAKRHPPTRTALGRNAVFGRWKRLKKSSDTGQNLAKRSTYRNPTVERTPILPCCRDIKTA